MKNMKSNICFISLVFLLVTSCSQTERMGRRNTSLLSEQTEIAAKCDSSQSYDRLYISKISGTVSLGGEQYNTRISLYYIPDSVFYMSAVNSGFEIVRIGVFKDSIVYINRLEKVVYIKNFDDLTPPAPIIFQDLEYLINRKLVCEEDDKKQISDSTVLIDRSVKDIARVIYYKADNLKPLKFEFFQKKTGEYIVGEFTSDSIFVIYSNYIVRNLKIETWGGVMEYNRFINVDLTVNRNKYDIYYF